MGQTKVSGRGSLATEISTVMSLTMFISGLKKLEKKGYDSRDQVLKGNEGKGKTVNGKTKV